MIEIKKRDSVINVESLMLRLKTKNIPEYHYSVGEFKDMAVCLVENENDWCVFEGDRGLRYDEKKFENEADACLYFWELLKIYL